MENAIVNGDLEEVQCLIDQGDSVNKIYPASGSALHIASHHGKATIVQRLLDNSAYIEYDDWLFETPLHCSVKKGHLEVVKILLKSGAPLETRECEYHTGYNRSDGGNTAFLLAIKYGWVEIASLLLQKGASIHARSFDNLGALHLAVNPTQQYGLKTKPGDLCATVLFVLQQLSTLNSDFTAEDHLGQTALSLVSSIADLEAIRFLVDLGADINKPESKSGFTPLHHAASQGQIATTRYLLDCGAKINATTKGFDKTALHCAIQHPDIVNLLVEKGADMEARAKSTHQGLEILFSKPGETREDAEARKNTRSWTALHLASKEAQKETMEILLKLGASIEARDGSGLTVMCTALLSWSNASIDVSEKRAEAMIQTLMHYWPMNACFSTGVGKTALYVCAKYNVVDVANFLIDHGALEDDSQRINLHVGFPRFGSRTSLHYASRNRHWQVVKVLVAAGMNVDARDDEQKTALHLAARKQVEEEWQDEGIPFPDINRGDDAYQSCKALLEGGANLDPIESDGSTPLHRAAEHSETRKAMELLLASGARTDLVDDAGRTALFSAARSNDKIIFDALLAHNLDPNLRDYDGDTALHVAAQLGSNVSIECLLSIGIDVNVRNLESETPLLRACQNGNKELILLLINHGADSNLASISGWTPLMYAVKSNEDLVTKALLKVGANPRHRTRDNWTALHSAISCATEYYYGNQNKQYFLETVKVLLEYGAEVNVAAARKRYERHIPPEGRRLPALRYIERDFVERETPLHLSAGPNLKTASNIGRLFMQDQTKVDAFRSVLIETLLEHNPDLDVRDAYGATPLHRAVASDYISASTSLLEAGADVNVVDNQGQTALHWAIRNEVSDQIISLLLAKGADESIVDREGNTPAKMRAYYPADVPGRGRGKSRGGRGRGGRMMGATWPQVISDFEMETNPRNE